MSDASIRHWQKVWDGRDPSTTSWFQETPTVSFELFSTHVSDATSVVDIGSGRSRLVSRLLDAGIQRLEMLDIAAPALEAAAAEIGWNEAVTWTVADVTTHLFDRQYDVWHDRAVFHFLTNEAQRDGYRRALNSATVIGSTMIVATFAEGGPDYCSGLPVQQYSADSLHAQFPGFERVGDTEEHHAKPDGETQHFQYVVLRRVV